MKRIFKWPIKMVWRATGSIRRPLVRELGKWLDRYVVIISHAATEEANIGLDFAAAEMARMQSQVQAMCEAVESAGRDDLIIVCL